MSNRLSHIQANRRLRAERVRSRVSGTSARPRLSLTISNRHVSAQLIDDTAAATLLSGTTVNVKAAEGTISEQCAWLGADIAKKADKAGIKRVVFDRSHRAYQQRLGAFATAARNNGLEF